MANHCDNHIRVECLPEHVDEIKSLIFDKEDGQTITFESTVPMPKELIDTTGSLYDKTDKPLTKEEQQLIDKYGHTNWLSWSVNNWGTKWDSMETAGFIQKTLQNGNVVMSAHFITAWSPPTQWFEKLCEKLKHTKANLTLKYAEPGMLFGGCISQDEKADMTNEDWDEDEIFSFLRKSPCEDSDF